MADLLGGADPHPAITALTAAGHETDTCRIGALSRDPPPQHPNPPTRRITAEPDLPRR